MASPSSFPTTTATTKQNFLSGNILAYFWCPVDESFTLFHRRILDIVTNVTEDYK